MLFKLVNAFFVLLPVVENLWRALHADAKQRQPSFTRITVRPDEVGEVDAPPAQNRYDPFGLGQYFYKLGHIFPRDNLICDFRFAICDLKIVNRNSAIVNLIDLKLRALQAASDHPLAHLVFAENILGFLLALDLDLIERRLGDVNHALVEQILHLPEEEGQQQSSDMGAVDVGIRHQYYLAVSAFGQIELVYADTGSQRADNGPNLIVCQHFFQSRLFHVEDFSLEWQDCLDISIPSSLCRAAGRVTFDYEDLGVCLFLT